MLKYALLGILNYQSMTGYELKQFMDSSTKHFWYADQSQIYRTLKSLSEQKFLESSLEAQDARPDKRIYSITDSGKASLQNWLETPLTKTEPVKEKFLLQLFFSALLDKQTILMHLNLQLNLYKQELRAFETQTGNLIEQAVKENPSIKKDALLWQATLNLGQHSAITIIAWLKETIAMIEKEF